MTDEPHPYYAMFLTACPEHAGKLNVVCAPDGTDRGRADVATVAAFVRWCLANGYGSRRKHLDFLADILPGLEEADRRRKARAGARPDPDAAAG